MEAPWLPTVLNMLDHPSPLFLWRVPGLGTGLGFGLLFRNSLCWSLMVPSYKGNLTLTVYLRVIRVAGSTWEVDQLVTPCWMEGCLASHSSQHVGRCSLVVSHHERSHCACFSRSCAQGSAISAFSYLVAQRYFLHRQGFSSSVCQAVVRATWVSISKICQQCWKELVGWCAQQGVPNNIYP